MTTEPTTTRSVPEDTLALRLVIARVYRGHYNAASAALAVGVPRQSWSNWERGKPIQHEDAMLAKIARVLDVDEDWLRDGGPLGGATMRPDPNGPDGGELLPRLDSNQEPSGYLSPQVRDLLRAA